MKAKEITELMYEHIKDQLFIVEELCVDIAESLGHLPSSKIDMKWNPLFAQALAYRSFLIEFYGLDVWKDLLQRMPKFTACWKTQREEEPAALDTREMDEHLILMRLPFPRS